MDEREVVISFRCMYIGIQDCFAWMKHINTRGQEEDQKLYMYLPCKVNK